MPMCQYNESYYNQPDPTDNWNVQTTILDDSERELLRLLGFDRLTIFIDDKNKGTDLESLFKLGYSSNALDLLEQFFFTLASHAPGYKTKAWEFQQKVNESMADFECPWRLSDGLFFKVEAEFLHRELVQKGEDQLRQQGFSGLLSWRRLWYPQIADATRTATSPCSAGSVSTLQMTRSSSGKRSAVRSAR